MKSHKKSEKVYNEIIWNLISPFYQLWMVYWTVVSILLLVLSLPFIFMMEECDLCAWGVPIIAAILCVLLPLLWVLFIVFL